MLACSRPRQSTRGKASEASTTRLPPATRRRTGAGRDTPPIRCLTPEGLVEQEEEEAHDPGKQATLGAHLRPVRQGEATEKIVHAPPAHLPTHSRTSLAEIFAAPDDGACEVVASSGSPESRCSIATPAVRVLSEVAATPTRHHPQSSDAPADMSSEPLAAQSSGADVLSLSPDGQRPNASRLLLLDLPADGLALVMARHRADDELAVALTCTALRNAVASARLIKPRGPRSTRLDSLCNSLAKLQWGVLDCGAPLCAHLCHTACMLGSLDALVWLRSVGCPWDEGACAMAAHYGHLSVLQWARANGCPWHEATCWCAAQSGHLPVLQWARANGCPWNDATCWCAAKNGHLSVLQWARVNGCPWNEDTCRCAAHNGHLSVLKWARANGCPWDARTCDHAAFGGQLAVLQWAHANGCPWDCNTCTFAAEAGHLAVLQWARANGCPWDEETCRCAAEAGQLTALQWARENGCPRDGGTCAGAAARGQLAVLQWARAHGCPWGGVATCHYAAEGGHLAVLQWLRAHGCPWDESTCRVARRNGHQAVLDWARANGCPAEANEQQ
jgi:hypothetical protein